MKTKDIEIGGQYLVVSPHNGPRGSATVVAVDEPSPDPRRPSQTVRVRWGPGVSVWTDDRTTSVRPADIVRPLTDDERRDNEPLSEAQKEAVVKRFLSYD